MTNHYGLELKPPVKVEKVKQVESQLGVTFPNEYVEFISHSNGAEGSIGENYIILWSVDDIVEFTIFVSFVLLSKANAVSPPSEPNNTNPLAKSLTP
ncbi:SMI1/KNR4 family protein [Virgibacillus kekensis]|uniref:SMI1/KNR4 family protein n=1 Tax=Virgibacillus kekensis TaxID=202261 RepID=A0ABV9DF01_9BACI